MKIKSLSISTLKWGIFLTVKYFLILLRNLFLYSCLFPVSFSATRLVTVFTHFFRMGKSFSLQFFFVCLTSRHAMYQEKLIPGVFFTIRTQLLTGYCLSSFTLVFTAQGIPEYWTGQTNVKWKLWSLTSS